jgi:hypothetical protein
MKTETEKLQDWVKDQKDNHGLVDFKMTLNPFADKSTMTVESVAKEINEMLNSSTVAEDQDFF